jgi:hypothetical protein
MRLGNPSMKSRWHNSDRHKVAANVQMRAIRDTEVRTFRRIHVPVSVKKLIRRSDFARCASYVETASACRELAWGWLAALDDFGNWLVTAT